MDSFRKGLFSWGLKVAGPGQVIIGRKGLSRDANKDWSLDGDIGQTRVISEVVSNITSDSGRKAMSCKKWGRPAKQDKRTGTRFGGWVVVRSAAAGALWALGAGHWALGNRERNGGECEGERERAAEERVQVLALFFSFWSGLWSLVSKSLVSWSVLLCLGREGEGEERVGRVRAKLPSRSRRSRVEVV